MTARTRAVFISEDKENEALARKIARAHEQGVSPVDMHKRARENRCLLCGVPRGE